MGMEKSIARSRSRLFFVFLVAASDWRAPAGGRHTALAMSSYAKKKEKRSGVKNDNARPRK